MKKVEDFSNDIQLELIKLYLSTSSWSHRKLQREILGVEAHERGGGFLALRILRANGILDDSLKGIFLKVFTNEELIQKFNSTNTTVRARDIIQNIFNQTEMPTLARKTYLLTWNPEKWKWSDLKEDLNEFQKEEKFIRPWGCGNNKSIKEGDRIFFIKLGKELPRGIMASGYVVKESYLGNHWNGEKEKEGLFVDVEFDVFLDPENEHENFIKYEQLMEDDVFKLNSWSVHVSGTVIAEAVASKLENEWHPRFLKNIGRRFSLKGNYREGKSSEYISKKYERDENARKECLRIRGVICLACEIDFQEKYGKIGKGFIHVHHVIPLSERDAEYSPDPATDLIPLCPNCHAMIHKLGKPYSLEELIKILKLNN
ncbi:HNH endonuclease [Bacteriovorax sp. PP10]|uniref:HNH endonuclease n=1 Tax=Bacteriovorax antarcticus TaxID=3088717 RepID=A0ABU5VW24_9BACT|nr:HNH endonuclease [Bacteriovorax sp. PP10]MEA9357258.1 HNH endonuclease [Bacteriovorax sp. PP10]